MCPSRAAVAHAWCCTVELVERLTTQEAAAQSTTGWQPDELMTIWRTFARAAHRAPKVVLLMVRMQAEQDGAARPASDGDARATDRLERMIADLMDTARLEQACLRSRLRWSIWQRLRKSSSHPPQFESCCAAKRPCPLRPIRRPDQTGARKPDLQCSRAFPGRRGRLRKVATETGTGRMGIITVRDFGPRIRRCSRPCLRSSAWVPEPKRLGLGLYLPRVLKPMAAPLTVTPRQVKARQIGIPL